LIIEKCLFFYEQATLLLLVLGGVRVRKKRKIKIVFSKAFVIIAKEQTGFIGLCFS